MEREPAWPTQRDRSRARAQLAALVLGLVVFLGAWLFDYAAQFLMLASGRTIKSEVEAALSAVKGICAEGWSDSSERGRELEIESRYVESLVLDSALGATARTHEITSWAPWLDGFEAGETIAFRFRCEGGMPALRCVGDEAARLRFRGAFLYPCES